MKMHMSTSIEGLLNATERKPRSRKVLNYVFKDDGSSYRNVRELQEDLRVQLAKGHRLIKDDRCNNFDPIKGCLGHEHESDTPVCETP
jgi:hypothetical protein